MDLTGYERYFANDLQDYSLPEEEMQKSLKALDGLPLPKGA